MPHWHNSTQSTSTNTNTTCPCTKTVRDWNEICQISDIWRSIPLPFAMHPIVDIMASPRTMNNCSQKQHLPYDHPVHQNFEDGMAILDTWYYFFTLPNTLHHHTHVHLVQWDTCLYDLQDLKPEKLAEWIRNKKNVARRRKKRRIRERVEKLVQLKKELRLMHKRSQTESGKQGIV